MKALRKSFFSLIEIAIAVGILAVGATSVVTLVPSGIQQKKNAIAENYSAILTSDAQSYFSGLAGTRSGWDSLIALPTYSDVFNQTGFSDATKGANISGDIYQALNPAGAPLDGVFIISKSSGTKEDYAGQLTVWRSNLQNLGTQTTTSTTETVSEPPVFNVTSGTVSNTAPATVRMNCLASEWGNGYHNYDVYFELIITEPGKASYTIYPFGRNVAATSGSAPWSLPNVPAGTTIVAKAIDAENPNRERTITQRLSTDTVHVLTLKNGDDVPANTPFYASQASASAIVQPYISADGKTITLDKDQVIYLFDLNTSGPYDYQDLVVMANLAPENEYSLSTVGENGIAISPTNSSYSFELSTDTGVVLDRDMMHDISTGHNPLETQYVYPNSVTFSANNLKMKTKSGDNAKISVDGQEVNIDNKLITMHASNDDSLNVKVWKNNSGMGSWQIQLLPSKGTVDDGTTTPVVTTEPTVSTTTTTTKTVGVGVNAEISWPLSQHDYSRRSKIRYYNEYYDMAGISN